MNQDNVALYPVSVEERDAALALYRAVERLDQDWRGRTALDAAAAFVARMRYGFGKGDPIVLLGRLEDALRELR